MGRVFKSPMSVFLDDKGAVLNPLPIRSRKLLEQLENIIHHISVESPALKPKLLPCLSAPKRKRCLGKIDASIDLQNYHIIWHCLLCGNNGSISRWRNTVFDKGHGSSS